MNVWSIWIYYRKNLKKNEVDHDIESLSDKCKYGDDSNISSETLNQLATEPYYFIRIAVAKNPNTPPETLQQLATDEYWLVRSCVAINPNTPPEALKQLATDEEYGVRYYVAKNPNTTELIRRLVKMKNSQS